MKSKSNFLFGVLLGVLLVAAFSVGKAYATTGCFADTVGNFYETAICWMKDNGITNGTSPGIYSPNGNVTRGQMAVFLQRQAEIPPSTGDIYITQPLTALQPNGNFASTARVSYYDDYTLLGATTAGVNYFMLSAAVPASLYGRSTYLKGVQVCYDASPFRGGTLTLVSLKHFASSGGASVLLREVLDSAARTDSACRTYSISSPLNLLASDHVSLNLAANLPSSFDFVYISSISIILSPSTLTPALARPLHEQEPILESDPATSIGSNR
jgi:hypothetical protein